MWNILRSIISLGCCLLSFTVLAREEDSARAPLHQLRLDLEIAHPVYHALKGQGYSYEGMAAYYFRKEVYGVLEGGFGGSSVDYPDLSYSSSNLFFRAGLDKALIKRQDPADWDLLFIGLRYGLALIKRQEASFTTADSLWGNTSGTVPGKQFAGHWAEVIGGMRVGLLPGLMAGWNIRGKFLINPDAFRELPPNYIAGFGKGDKTTSFDFNVYLCYAIRWGHSR